MLLIRAIKFIIVAILSVIYWPLNASLLWMQGHYRGWQKDDVISFIIATPLYYLFFVIVIILSIPLEIMGGDGKHSLHPPVGGFR
jgi:hypothetical protein